ncbi:MAG TPA: sigma-70 family RNA polymerase sigma factor, partial [Chthoniobacteraceae bacterium]|nr:sigma-70 family RNA polymerase sigma factor [Chthoniobacteraceae bacterium]
MTADACALAVSAVELAQANHDDAPQLSARLAAGEEAAWVDFHARTFDRLLRYLLTVSHGDEDAAREALQLAYVKAVRYVRRFETEQAMWAWLAQIARGCLIDLARHKARYRSLLARVETPQPSEQLITDDGSDHVTLMAAGIARLSESERALIEARYMADQS